MGDLEEFAKQGISGLNAVGRYVEILVVKYFKHFYQRIPPKSFGDFKGFSNLFRHPAHIFTRKDSCHCTNGFLVSGVSKIAESFCDDFLDLILLI